MWPIRKYGTVMTSYIKCIWRFDDFRRLLSVPIPIRVLFFSMHLIPTKFLVVTPTISYNSFQRQDTLSEDATICHYISDGIPEMIPGYCHRGPLIFRFDVIRQWKMFIHYMSYLTNTLYRWAHPMGCWRENREWTDYTGSCWHRIKRC